MKVINIFAGPGCGKSTVAAGLYHKLKTLNKNVEYVSEYAKDLIYENRFERLNDYLYVLAEQHHRLLKLSNSVEYAICDGSFLLGYIHCKKNGFYNHKLLKELVLDIFNSYENFNYLLPREKKFYTKSGRKESLKEAIKLDKKLSQLFTKKKIVYKKISFNKAIPAILQDIHQMNN